MGFCLSLTLGRVLVDKQLHKISYSLNDVYSYLFRYD